MKPAHTTIRTDRKVRATRHLPWLIAAIMLLPLAAPLAARAADPLANTPPVWKSVPAEQVKTDALEWLKSETADAGIRAKGEALWSKLPPDASDDDLLSVWREPMRWPMRMRPGWSNSARNRGGSWCCPRRRGCSTARGRR